MARDPAATRLKTLNAAETLFLEHGFDGTSLGRIAKHAEVNQSLLSHHFGSKSGLRDATWARLSERYFGDQLAAFSAESTKGEALLHDAITRFFRFNQATPGFARFRAWHFLSDVKSLSEPEAETIKTGIAHLRLGQQFGLLRNDIPAPLIWASFISLVQHWFYLRGTYSDVFLALGDTPEARDEAYLESALAIFFGGIRPQPHTQTGADQ